MTLTNNGQVQVWSMTSLTLKNVQVQIWSMATIHSIDLVEQQKSRAPRVLWVRDIFSFIGALLDIRPEGLCAGLVLDFSAQGMTIYLQLCHFKKENLKDNQQGPVELTLNVTVYLLPKLLPFSASQQTPSTAMQNFFNEFRGGQWDME